MYKKIIIFIIVLSSVSFFNLIFIPIPVINALSFAMPVVMLALIIMFRLYDDSAHFKPRFNIELILIVIAVVLSMFAAYYFHQQEFGISALSQRFIYFLLFYPLLHVLKPKPEELVKIIIAVGIIYAIVYILQDLAYPRKLVTAKLLLDRSTVRITIAGSGFIFLAYLIGLTNFIKTYSFRYLMLCILSLIIFVLLGSRQVMGPALILTILSILFSKKVKSRAMIIVLMALMVIPIYFTFVDIFDAMFKLSQHQAAFYQRDVRFKAMAFYLYEFFPNKISYLTGNGIGGGNSPLAKEVYTYNNVFGFYQSDIGIIGDFTKFGALFILAQLSMFIRILFMRLPIELEFVKLNTIAFLVTIMTGSSFNAPDFIVLNCMMLYLVDVSGYFMPVKVSRPSLTRQEEISIPSQ
jgi:hypothetical protein